MKEMFEWNPVFNFVMEIKHRYMELFGDVEYREYHYNNEDITCLEYWIEMINDQEYKDRIRLLELNQKDELLLVRYAKYSNALSDEIVDLTLEEMWEMYDGFYLECRSIVIDLLNEEIALCPFKKFRNLNECAENMLDVIKEKINTAKNVEISNKLDGSMQSARFYKGKVLMAGSQAIDTKRSWRLEDGYKMLNENENYVRMLKDFPRYTFIFEYISLADAHVVKYKKEQEGLYLVGMRDVYSGSQYSYNILKRIAEHYNVKCTEVYDKTLDEVLEECKTMKSEDQEGFVMNIDGHLLKIKGDDYVHIHKILSKISSINLIIRAIADDTLDDLNAKIPTAYKNRVKVIEKICSNYIKQQQKNIETYYNAAPNGDKKEFMTYVSKNVPKKYQGYVRNIYLGHDNNFLKRGYNTQTPRYIKLVDMGIKREDYKNIFMEEE